MMEIQYTSMNLQQIKSSLIESIGFDPEESVLFVRFHGKADIYTYQNVAPELFGEMMEQSSIGKSIGGFFASRIKPFSDKFPFMNIGAALPEPTTDFTVDGTPLPAIVAAPEIIPPEDPEALKQEALALSEKTKAIEITSPEAYELAATTLLAIAGMRTALEATFRPDIQEKHKIWKAALAVLQHYDAPLAEDDNRLRLGMIAFKKQQDANRGRAEQAERERLQAEADAEAKSRSQEMQIADAIDAEQRGEPELAKVILNSAPLPMQARYVAPVTYASTVPRAAGISYVEDWDYEIVDEKQIPRKYLVPDAKALKNEATTLKARAEIPGVRFFDRGGLRASVKAKKRA